MGLLKAYPFCTGGGGGGPSGSGREGLPKFMVHGGVPHTMGGGKGGGEGSRPSSMGKGGGGGVSAVVGVLV